MKFLKKLRPDEKDASAIEYGLIAALVAVGAIAGMGQLGSSLDDTFIGVSGKLNHAN